jgi:hypothetical protein
MVRVRALEAGVFGVDNRKIPASNRLCHPHRTFMNISG